MNHYETLGVSSSATNADLKWAYRNLVKCYHPDINPTAEGKSKIRLINEAYEVLSEHYSRQAYDLILSGRFMASEPPKETEAEKYRREYLRKKAHEKRVNSENVLRVKIKFYRFQRIVCFLFFASGILFTIDYYYSPYHADSAISSMKIVFNRTEIVSVWGTLNTDQVIFKEFQRNGGEQLTITFSSIFKIPTKVKLIRSTSTHIVYGTLHGFGNVLSIIVLVFSGIVIRGKEYTDFRLTAGIVPGFLVPFMFLMALL